MTKYYVAKTGHDNNNNGLSAGSPFLTITKGVSKLGAGDELEI
ncbi:MAG: pectate lyase, partial [Tenericutes bacterium]